MSLPIEIQNEIQRFYSLRQNENARALTARKEEVYEFVPQLKALSRKMIDLSVQCAKANVLSEAGQATRLADLKASQRALRAQQDALLSANGYPTDYLEMSYTCPDCGDTGRIGEKKCHCYKQFVINQLYRQSNLPSLETQNFSKLRMDCYPKDQFDKNGRSVYDRMKRIITFCKRYAESFTTEDAKSLLICGATGTSKTFLCSCIAKAVMDQGYSVVYLTASEVFEMIHQNTWSFGSESDSNHSLYQLFECDLLIIDDLGSEPETTNTANYFFRCINERLTRRNSTIISTNHELAELNYTYTQRVVDRITSEPYTCILTTDGVDFNVRRGGNTSRYLS